MHSHPASGRGYGYVKHDQLRYQIKPPLALPNQGFALRDGYRFLGVNGCALRFGIVLSRANAIDYLPEGL